MRRIRVLLYLAAAFSLSSCGYLFIATYRAAPTEGKPSPLSVHLSFVGAESFYEQDLRRLIEDYMYDLSADPDRESAAIDAGFDLQDFYVFEGFPDVLIEHEIRRQPGEEPGEEILLVTFTISEGPRVTVSDLQLVGLQGIPEEDILSLWSRRYASSLNLGYPLYVETEMFDLAAKIVGFYRAQGFLDASVGDPLTNRLVGKSEAAVTIPINEGAKYFFGEFVLTEELAKALGDQGPAQPTGAEAHILLIDQYRTEVLSKLREIGYADAQIVLDLQRNSILRTVDLRIDGSPGDKGIIERIEVEGLESVHPGTVREQLLFAKGEVFDGSKIDETLRKLYLTSLFQSVEIKHEWLSPGKLLLRISLEESDSKSIEVLLGYGSYEEVRGKIRFEEKNLFGTGNQFSIETKASTRGYRAVTTVTDPSFLDSETSASISGETFEREEPTFTDRAVSSTVSLTRRLGPNARSRIGYSIGRRDGKDIDVIDPAAILDDFREATVFLEIGYDRRDGLLFPRSGYQISVRTDTTDPALGSEIDFTRLSVDSSAYIPIPLIEGMTLALRSSQGWLWPDDGSDNVPLQSRYYNGGENTVRSFREAQLGPKDINNKPTGGEYRNIFNAELRVPVYKILEAGVFVDAGNLGSKVNDYGFSKMRYGYGAGLRLALPIGPVRADLAYNPDPTSDEPDWVAHFSVGYPF